MFIEIHHKIGSQNRTSLVNTDKIIAFNPCFELKYDKCVLFEYMDVKEFEKIPDNPLITDYPDSVVKITKYNVECGDFDYDISIEEYERIKKILSGV